MRIIRDDVYVFSVSRSKPGEIVACRAQGGDGAIGKNINDVLALDKRDVEYAHKSNMNEEYRSVCLSCNPAGEKRVVAFFDFMCRSSSLCLAVVFYGEPKSVAKALSALGEGVAYLTPSLVYLIESGGDKFSLADHEAFTNIAYLYGCIAPLGELRAYHAVGSAEFLRRYVELVSELIGVGFEYAVRNDSNFTCFNGDSAVFSGGFCASFILVAAMLARRYSRLNQLDVEVIMGRDGVLILLGFDADEYDALDGAEFLEKVADSYGMVFNRSVKEGRALIEVLPFYCDVGLAEVKERDSYPHILDFM